MITENNIGIDLGGDMPSTVKCWQIGPNVVAVLCPHCGLYHFHGWYGLPFSDPAGGGHRVADCRDGDGGSYYLAPDPKPATQRVLRSLGRRRPAKPPVRRAGDEQLRAWIAGACRQGAECVAVPSDLFASWTKWARANRYGVGDFLHFKLRITRLGFHRECGRPWFRGLELIEPGAALLRLQIGEAARRGNNARAAERFNRLLNGG